MSPARTAGILLLLTAMATAVSVATRLAGSDEPPAGSPLYLPIILDTGLYAVAGAARVASGLALLAAAPFLRRGIARAGWSLRLADIAAGLLAVSGAITAVSGGCMLALAAAIPEQTAFASGVPGWLEPLNSARSLTGKAGFALAGLGLIALAPSQWHSGGILKAGAVAAAVIGIAMLFIWVDAATVMHRVSGIAYLLWLIIAGVWLAAGLLRNPQSLSRPNHLPGRPGAIHNRT